MPMSEVWLCLQMVGTNWSTGYHKGIQAGPSVPSRTPRLLHGCEGSWYWEIAAFSVVLALEGRDLVQLLCTSFEVCVGRFKTHRRIQVRRQPVLQTLPWSGAQETRSRGPPLSKPPLDKSVGERTYQRLSQAAQLVFQHIIPVIQRLFVRIRDILLIV
jgi:hypothetical protein